MKNRNYAVTANLFLSLFLGVAIGTYFAVNFLIPSLLIFAATFIPKGTSGKMVAHTSSLDVSTLPSELNSYAMAQRDGIVSKVLVDGMGFLDYFQLLTGIKDKVPLTELVVGSVLQPGGKDAFNPLNNKVQFKARIGQVRAMKVDLQFKPSQVQAIWKSYLGQVSQGKIDPYVVPFEAYIFDRIVAVAQNDIRIKALFKGVYNASGTAAADTVDGLLTIVAAAIEDESIAPGQVSSGEAITASNGVDQVRLVVDKVFADANYQDVPMICLVSPQVKRFYELDYQATYGALPYNKEFNKTFIDGTNIEIKSEPGMTGSDRILITPESNLFWLVDEESDANNVTVEKALRNINIMMDMQAAPEFGIIETIWTNDYEGIV